MISLLFESDSKLVQKTIDEVKNEARQIICHHLDQGKIPPLIILEKLCEEESYRSWLLKVTDFNCLIANFRDYQWDEIIGYHYQCIHQISQTDFDLTMYHDCENDWELMLQILCIKMNQEWNNAKPFISVEYCYQDETKRLTLIHWSLSQDKQSKFFLRNLRFNKFNLTDFLPNSSTSTFLKNEIKEGKNILVCGSTGSGKTTFLSTLLDHLNPDDRPLLIQDVPEIQIKHPFTTSLLTKNSHDSEMCELLSYGMRMTPTKIVVGELRGKEILGYLLALNTGHKGVYSTIHSSNAVDGIHRLAQLFCLYSGNGQIMYRQVLQLFSKNIDYVVYLKNKKVIEIIKILGIEEDQIIHQSL